MFLLQAIFRPVDVVQPDLTYFCEALLVSHCFSEAQELGYIISRFMKQLKQQVRSTKNVSIISQLTNHVTSPIFLCHKVTTII